MASPVIIDDPIRRSLLAVTAAWLIGALHHSYLTPRVHPRLRRGTVRLSNVDGIAAAQWQNANDPGMISVKLDAPARDSLARHGLLIALAVAVAVLVAGLV